jgi:hypothetical protein
MTFFTKKKGKLIAAGSEDGMIQIWDNKGTFTR